MNFTHQTLSAIFLAAFTSCAAADPIELPPRRPGYWEIVVTHGEKRESAMTIHACIDAATDKAMMDAGSAAIQSMCAAHEIKREGEAYVWDTACTMGPMKTTSHVEVTGDFQSAYQMKISGELSGLPTSSQKTLTTQNAKWVAAACPAGVKAGDMQMPGGLTVNVRELIKSLGVAKTPWQP